MEMPAGGVGAGWHPDKKALRLMAAARTKSRDARRDQQWLRAAGCSGKFKKRGWYNFIRSPKTIIVETKFPWKLEGFPTLDYSMTDESHPQSDRNLTAQIEALLFVAPGPVSTPQLAAALETSTREVEAGLDALEEIYRGRGLRLQKHAGKVQITSAPEYGELVERFLGLEASSRLSRAALEALAIVAYQQPITRPEIDAIRGVNSDGVLKSLLSKGLIQEAGRAERPGRPILYNTTPDFLSHFGLSSLTELPPLVREEEFEEEGPDQLLKG